MFKTKPAPSLDERLAASAAKREAALSVFRAAADDLDVAEAEALAVMSDIDEQMERLAALRLAALDEAADASIKSANLRTFLG